MLKLFKDENTQDDVWYENGLQFKCTGCGLCCTGAPGYVWVSDKEIVEIANYLKLDLAEFISSYLRRVDGKFSLLEKQYSSSGYDCIFLKENKCSIYSLRPTQCRTFPWWPQNLKSKSDWLEAAKHCEGISSEAPTVSKDVILEQLDLQLKTISD